jgi:hypothetical protein
MPRPSSDSPPSPVSSTSFSSIPLLIDHIGNDLLCSLCFNLFTRPFSLPCQHHFCFTCIDPLIDGESKCPKCEFPFWTRDLKPNLVLKNLVEGFHEMKRESRQFYERLMEIQGENSNKEENESKQANGRKRKAEEIDDSTSDHPLVPVARSDSPIVTASSSSIVLCTSGLSESDYRELIRSVRTLPCRLQLTYDVCVTHLILPLVSEAPRLTRRTMKYLLGILDGKYILSMDWIRSAFLTREFPNETKFEIEGDTNSGQCFTPRKARINHSKGNLIFQGIKFIVFGDFGVKDPTESELIMLIEKAGGSLIDDFRPLQALRTAKATGNYESFTHEFPLIPCSSDFLLIVRPDFSSHIDQPFLYHLLTRTGLSVISLVWVFDSISQFSKQEFSRYQFHLRQKK